MEYCLFLPQVELADMKYPVLLIFALFLNIASGQVLIAIKNKDKDIKCLQAGDMQIDKYLPLLKGKNIGIIANQTSLLGKTHLADTLLSLHINIKTIKFIWKAIV